MTSTATSPFSLTDLEAIIAVRAKADADQSYTAKLVAAGASRIARKLGEEAIETVIAGIEGDDKELTGEASDLLYHLLVLLHVRKIPLHYVLGELERRTQQTGLAEKASRPGSVS